MQPGIKCGNVSRCPISPQNAGEGKKRFADECSISARQSPDSGPQAAEKEKEKEKEKGKGKTRSPKQNIILKKRTGIGFG